MTPILSSQPGPLSTPLRSTVLGPELGTVPDDHPFRREFRRWLEDNVPGVPEPFDQDEKFAFRRAWQQTLHRGGWAGPAWPERFGGRGAGPLEQFMYYEELALARAPQPVNAPGIILLGPGYGPQYIAWFLPLLVLTVTSFDAAWRRILMLWGLIAVLTYLAEYLLLRSHGALLVHLLPQQNFAWATVLATPKGTTLLRLPLFVAYCALWIKAGALISRSVD